MRVVSIASALLICISQSSLMAADAVFTLGDVLHLSTKEQLQRGALQRPSMFLDVVGTKKNLEIALVIDGTDSMSQEFNGVVKQLQRFVEGIQAQKGAESEIRFALVVYRDDKSPSGACSVPIAKLTSDVEKFKKALVGEKPESGAPHFSERLDVGVQQALTRVNWSGKNEDVTRWIILCGDSPPYYPGHGLKHTSKELSALANEKGVEIYSVLCNSGFTSADAEASEKLTKVAKDEAPAARRFMGDLSEQTNGKFMDLWNPEVVEQLLGLARERQTFQQTLKRISDDDLVACRSQAKRSANGSRIVRGGVTIAVLPHASLTSMTFDSEDEQVLAATELRERFRSLAGIEVISVSKTEAKFKSVKTDQDEAQVLADFADVVDADFVVWGGAKHVSGTYDLRTALYNGTDGKLIATSHKTADGTNGTALMKISQQSAYKLCKLTAQSLKRDDIAADIVAAFESVEDDDNVSKALRAKFAADIRAHRAILSGLDLLERSLGYEKGKGENGAASLLKSAETHLTNALQFEPGNAFAHLLLASCYHNLGDAEQVDDYANKPYIHLRKAYNNRDSLGGPDSPARMEIEADYELLVNKQADKAIELYHRLADVEDTSNARFALRANWMLAGIYLGDWDVQEQSADVVSVDKARNHIVQILAHWEESDEATFYRAAMKGDTADGLASLEVGKTALAAR